jgi:hypothetical protein
MVFTCTASACVCVRCGCWLRLNMRFAFVRAELRLASLMTDRERLSNKYFSFSNGNSSTTSNSFKRCVCIQAAAHFEPQRADTQTQSRTDQRMKFAVFASAAASLRANHIFSARLSQFAPSSNHEKSSCVQLKQAKNTGSTKHDSDAANRNRTALRVRKRSERHLGLMARSARVTSGKLM